MKVQRLFYLTAWAILTIIMLTGCGGVKGLGSGLGDVFKRIRLP